ncbi:MAG TPA: cytochrome b/b6 domain-containing protein [Steroidobacteraceae bacterium]|nr:cytochrome b/b6 domain-containing protein [Steroidobacteraceae bacterium]
MSARASTPPGRLIWDLPVRIFHWALVLAVLGSWITHKLDAFAWHVWFGYSVLVLTSTRIVWGFVGPRHARFASFVRSPASITRHVRSLFGADTADRYPGHNPLGALMVLTFLALLTLQAGAGLFANDDIANTGPLYGYVSDATSDTLARVHKLFAKLLWFAVWTHVAAVFAYLLVRRVNLIGPMLTGRKTDPWLTPADEIAGSQLWRAVLIAAGCAAILYCVIVTAPEPSLILF